MNLTYNQAYKEITQIVDEIEGDKIQLDVLADKVKQAKALIDYCESKLKTIHDKVSEAILEKKEETRK